MGISHYGSLNSFLSFSVDRHSDPYRLYAEFEMSNKNYETARSILFKGAQSISESSPDGGLGARTGMARLFHTWAMCEWHLGAVERAEVLLDHALRLTDAGAAGSESRSHVLYSIALLEYARGEYILAQHCVGLCLKENVMPGGNARIWDLWADISTALNNPTLTQQCQEQAHKLRAKESMSPLLGGVLAQTERAATAASVSNSIRNMIRQASPAAGSLMRKEPWIHKIFHNENNQNASSSWFKGVSFPNIPKPTTTTITTEDPSVKLWEAEELTWVDEQI
jgi:hypothetical protein